MRILLINQYAGSPAMGMEYRPHWMAVEWQRLGHEVLVATADWTHLRRAQPPIRRGLAQIEGVPFRILPVPRHGGNGGLRFANILTFAASLRYSAPTLIGWRPDVVIASSTHPFDVRPAAHIADKSGARFVHEVHDLWPLTPRLLGGMSASHPMIRLMQREEDFACRRADVVVSILPSTKEYLVGRGLDPEKWVHVSNGVPESAVSGAQEVPAVPPPLRVGYFGAHGPANDLGNLISAAHLMTEDSVEFHLWGDGPEKGRLVAEAVDLSNLSFHEPVSQEEARRLMSTMDALYIGLDASPLFAFGISPNKMFDYMAAGRPIIQAIDSPGGPAETAGCALLCRPGRPRDVATAVSQLAGIGSEGRDRMGRLGRDYVRDHAVYPVLADAMVRAMSHCETTILKPAAASASQPTGTRSVPASDHPAPGSQRR